MASHAVTGAGLGVGDHACWRYADDDERRAVLTAYFLDGLAAGERLVYFGRRGTEDALDDHLAAHCDVAALRASGRLLVEAAEDAYLPGGTFDPDARIRAYELLVRDSLAAGYPAVRVFGDAATVAATLADLRIWTEYELRAELLAARLPIVGLCGYDLRHWGDRPFHRIDAAHHHALGDEERASAFHLHGTPAGALAVTGELDVGSVALARELLEVWAHDPHGTAIDLAPLAFADAAGMAEIYRTACAREDVDICDPPPLFRRAWQLLGYDDVVPLADATP